MRFFITLIVHNYHYLQFRDKRIIIYLQFRDKRIIIYLQFRERENCKMLKRKIYRQLCDWKQKSQGHTALMVCGARRTGKSFIVEEFAKNEYASYIIIDFGNVGQEVKDIFLQDTANLNLFFAKLSSYFRTKLLPRNTLIVFDEIQQFPPARQMIKYLVADGRYDYVETGSLIGLRQNTKDIIIPSEEEQINLYPLDFEEFLWAMGDDVTAETLWEHYENLTEFGQATHRRIMNDFRQYILVGGMPQSVNAYLKNQDFSEADEAKKRILDLYRKDITKFAGGYEEKVMSVFDAIPGQLTRKDKKYNLADISKRARYREYNSAFMWLKEAMIVNTCFNATDPNVGLSMSRDYTTQKCYMGDTGLLVTMTFMDEDFTDNELYRAVLFDKLNVNEGMLMENIVAQELRCHGKRLFFYSRQDSASRKNSLEIDFLIRQGKKISPVEVKSASSSRHVSLDKLVSRFSDKLGRSYILSPRDVFEKNEVVHLPLYMTMCL